MMGVQRDLEKTNRRAESADRGGRGGGGGGGGLRMGGKVLRGWGGVGRGGSGGRREGGASGIGQAGSLRCRVGRLVDEGGWWQFGGGQRFGWEGRNIDRGGRSGIFY